MCYSRSKVVWKQERSYKLQSQGRHSWLKKKNTNSICPITIIMRLSQEGREDSNVNTELAGEKMRRTVEKELYDLIHQEKNIIVP